MNLKDASMVLMFILFVATGFLFGELVLRTFAPEPAQPNVVVVLCDPVCQIEEQE